MGVDNAIEGNTRQSRCVAFVQKPPAAAHKLVLHVVGDPVIQLGEWPRAEWNDSLGIELDALMQEHHEDAGTSDSKFAAAYVDDTGRSLRTKTFTARTRPRAIDGDGASVLASMLDGSTQAQNQFIQQTGLALVRMFLTAQNAQIQTFMRITETLVERVVDSEGRTDNAREQYLQLREILTEMNAEKDSPEELTPAQQKFFELANQSLPMIIARLGAK